MSFEITNKITRFENEDIQISRRKLGENKSSTDDDINLKYASGEVRIVTEQARYPLDTITTMLETGKYILMPEFQRRHRWNVEQKSRLIESFIMNIPIPPIFLYEVNYSEYEVMDGLQRLTAIKEFYQDKFSLKNLEYWRELEGKKYSQLPSDIKRGIDRRYISSIILLKETSKNEEQEKALKQLVFERLNSGGTKLEYQESRNALYAGKFNNLCIKLSCNEYFCKIFKIPEHHYQDKNIPPKLEKNSMYSKMKDVEIVVRFFAMRFLDNYDMPLKNFLDVVTDQCNLLDDDVINEYENLFNETIKLAYNIFGEKAFGMWKVQDDDKMEFSTDPNLFLFDPMMLVLSTMLNKGNILIENKEDIYNGLRELQNKNSILTEGRRSTKNDIKERAKIFYEYFNSFIKC